MTSNKTSWIRPITGTIAVVFLCCTVLTFMQKVNAACIPCARDRVRLRAAHMWKLQLRSSGNPAR